ncbi:hypothetical protein NC653_006529 [Populus alba x Populus x berolinensis]|uniref:3-beta hydroxysteroid dehydrogenase/isomerase domain-containing protein n=1 Tax=Populus alba x Populus x berolinensis TaxID=444605 RepID=A0AAD6REP6_9ROSI|nr:hypothetical protein NC653_006529 [Populus alba x Populus x berolinensis]
MQTNIYEHRFFFNITWPDGNKDISYLTGLPGAKERLQIFKADLNEPESFNEAIEGCAGVLHLAPSLDLVDGEPEEICSKLNRAPSNIAIENDGEGSRENRRKNYTLRGR